MLKNRKEEEKQRVKMSTFFRSCIDCVMRRESIAAPAHFFDDEDQEKKYRAPRDRATEKSALVGQTHITKYATQTSPTYYATNTDSYNPDSFEEINLESSEGSNSSVYQKSIRNQLPLVVRIEGFKKNYPLQYKSV